MRSSTSSRQRSDEAEAALNFFVERGRDPSRLIVAFTGRVTEPLRFEFDDLSRRLGWSRILLRDPSDLWYHYGIGEGTDDFPGVVDLIARCRRDLGATHTTVVGYSAGGYAALVAGGLLGADLVHAFAPLTRLSPLGLVGALDPTLFRRRRDLIRLWVTRTRRRALFDADTVLAAGLGHTRTFVHYCGGYRRDRQRCEALASLPGVTLLAYPCGDHGVTLHVGGRYLIEAVGARTAEDVEEAFRKRCAV